MIKTFLRRPFAKIPLGAVFTLGLVTQTACLMAPPGGDGPYAGDGPGNGAAKPVAEGESGTPLSTPPSSPPRRRFTTDILLFAGEGAWKEEISALKKIFDRQGASYRAVDGEDLDAMSVDDMDDYGLFVFPGGKGNLETESMEPETRERIRRAVRERGVGYVGFCAGSFIAVAPKPPAGGDVEYGLGIVAGPVLDYYRLEYEGVEADMTRESFADGRKRELLWYGGPVTLAVKGSVVAKYPNGEPAISQVWSGNGAVVLSAVHPAAPEQVKEEFGLRDGDGGDEDIAWELIDSVLRRNPLETFK